VESGERENKKNGVKGRRNENGEKADYMWAS